jgi:endo-1,4-beta-xylanase
MIRVLVGLALLGVSFSALAQPLRDLAAQRNIHVGAAVDPSHFAETAYADTLAREFNQVTAENAMKFDATQPGPTTFTFAQADSIVTFAMAHNMAVRGHTLVWYNQVPRWVTTGSFTAQQLSDVLQNHIKTEVGHFAGHVYAWDVVNEAFNGDGTLRSELWYDTPGIGLTGTGYIEQAFRWAHDADPKALLFYNDFSAEGVNAKSDAIYNMVKDFKARGVPIDGVGLQMHWTTATAAISSMRANIQRLADLGVQVHITELDVRLPVDSSGSATSALLTTQAQIYGSMVSLCLEFPSCTAVQTWGFTDKYSWVPGTFPGNGAALEFDVSYQPKPAYTAMQNALLNSPPAIISNGLTNAASYANDTVSPSEIVTLFGANYGIPTLAVASVDADFKLPTLFSDTRLFFDNAPAPILYTQAGLTAAIVPYSVSGKTTTQMQYEYRGMRSNTVTVKVAPTHPGVFSINATGQGPGAIRDVAYNLITPDNPARKGSYILVFGTGGGVTQPQPADGQVTLGPPLPQLSAQVTAKIGGVDCKVDYSGGAVGLVAGAVQLNVLVDPAVPSGLQPLQIFVGGVPSQPGIVVSIE